METSVPEPQYQPRKSAVAAWIAYDVGNTLFFVGVMGIFFPLWITQDLGGDDATVGFALSVSMGVMLVVAPVVGAFSDHARRRMPFLAVGTFTCIVATVLLGVGGLPEKPKPDLKECIRRIDPLGRLGIERPELVSDKLLPIT